MKGNMKRLFCGMLAVMMVLCFVACSSDEDKVADYIADNKEQFVTAFEGATGGMATVDFETDGTVVVMKATYTSLSSELFEGKEDLIGGTLDSAVKNANMVGEMQKEEDAISGLRLELYASDGVMVYSQGY